MSALAVRAEGLSKRYRLSGRGSAYRTLRESLVDTLRAPIDLLARRPAAAEEDGRANGDDLWALRDVSFEVRHGDVLGIIGRNGAGKSTLLKLLTRITEPTAGRAVLHGRVGSLLEVGTGFHPELTGRENVFLNGAILGMPRQDIRRRFDEIVAFAELERFMDTPVKRYSSGMYTRLAFSVAAHLEPEILVVDEVLAVGDAQFQRKCLGKMSEVAGEGRTVLFVSHNMAAIARLTKSVVVLDAGRLIFDGATDHGVAEYFRRSGQMGTGFSAGAVIQGREAGIVPLSFSLGPAGGASHLVGVSRDLLVEVRFEVLKSGREFTLGVGIATADSVPVATCFSEPIEVPAAGGGADRAVFSITARIHHNLSPGLYSLFIAAQDARSRSTLFYEPNATLFEVVEEAGEQLIDHRVGSGFVRFSSDWSHPVPRS
ncbi:MAG TPA: polysaccharide ABC transporter ATP-binding protein [Chloroflexota bacterium]|jgi:lipopolysaccharide transport system ATP-binding protein